MEAPRMNPPPPPKARKIRTRYTGIGMEKDSFFKRLLGVYKLLFFGVSPLIIALVPVFMGIYLDDYKWLFGLIFTIPLAVAILGEFLDNPERFGL